MKTIFHQLIIHSSLEKVFQKISLPEGLDLWWTESSSGISTLDATLKLNFGVDYQWEAIVSKNVPNEEFELTLTKSDSDWLNTKVGFKLSSQEEMTIIDFYHSGWKEESDHFRISSFCWAMYLRILKRNLEFGEAVKYEERLNV